MLKRIFTLAVVLSASAAMIIGSTGTAARDGGDIAVAAGPGGTLVVAPDGSGDYTCIQAAINDFSVTEIVVMPGVYEENIQITKDLKIHAYDGPLTTVLDGSKHRRWTKGCGGPSVAQDNVIEINKALNVTIEGLCVTNGNCGINIVDDDRVTLRNCVFWANSSHGIQIQDNWTWQHSPRTTVYNCVCVANGGSGVFLGQYNGSGYHCPVVTLKNSILAQNDQYGISLSQPVYTADPGNVSLDYNCSTGNRLANYGPGIGQGQVIPDGPHSFTDSPYFINGNAGDFRLASWSRCIDAGSPGTGFMDPDGTTNDVGAYGGPGAATFFQNPTDGPIVRELTVTPGSVPQGTPLTIRAVGSVR
jgi:hypothetical protein